jgi:hypothetical protein
METPRRLRFHLQFLIVCVLFKTFGESFLFTKSPPAAAYSSSYDHTPSTFSCPYTSSSLAPPPSLSLQCTNHIQGGRETTSLFSTVTPLSSSTATSTSPLPQPIGKTEIKLITFNVLAPCYKREKKGDGSEEVIFESVYMNRLYISLSTTLPCPHFLFLFSQLKIPD